MLLDETLSRLRSLRVPVGVEWELIVVNNNSTDDTDKVVDRYSSQLPIRLLHESKVGLSNARNAALVEAKGELIIWTDDDVLVEPNWLVEYVSAATRFPQAAYFGGPVRPWFPEPPPRWLQEQYRDCGGAWALIDRGPHERPLMREEDDTVYGANMAFRSATLQSYRFDETLGHSGTNLGWGEEKAVQEQIHSAGGVGIWVPTAVVHHYVIPERMTLAYAWNRAYQSGRAAFLYSSRTNEYADCATFLGVPRWMYRRCAVNYARYFFYRMLRQPYWLTSYMKAAGMRGAFSAARKRR